MYITEKISMAVTDVLANNDQIEKEKKDAYAYCLDFALDLIVFNFSLILIGLITHQLLPTILFVIVMAPLKMLAGGAHASNPIICSVLSYCIYGLVMVLYSLIHLPILPILIITMILGGGIWLFAPVEHPNKRYTKNKKRRIKWYSAGIIIVIYIITTAMIILDKDSYCVLVMLCLGIILINQIIGLIMYKGEIRSCT